MPCGLPRPLAKFLAFLLSVSIITVSLAPLAGARAHQSPIEGQVQRTITPSAGAPEGAFPNIDEVKTRQHPRARAPQPNASATRSRRNPRVPRNGLRVGNRLPPPTPRTPRPRLPVQIPVPSTNLERADATTPPPIRDRSESKALLLSLVALNSVLPTFALGSAPHVIHKVFSSAFSDLLESPPNQSAAAFALLPQPQGGSPYGGNPASVPGVIEIENYDNGGQGVGYHDTTAGSHGQDFDVPNSPTTSFRQPTNVDIYKFSAYSNNYLVLGQAGDWTTYGVDVSSTGTYTLQAQVALGGISGTPGTFHVEFDGVDKTGPIQIPDTNWYFITVTKAGIQLSAGPHLMRVVWDTNASNGYSGDIDKLTFTQSLTPLPFVPNFLQTSLGRQPNPAESAYWTDISRAAYAHSQGALQLAFRELGRTVFESAEYVARNRSDRDYVYDLYKSYLMREPDQAGWDSWTNAVPLYGREQVRRGFDESSEFLNLVGTLTVSGAPSSAVSSLSSALVDPFNQPGNGLASRDAVWSANLLSLPGRAGLDLGLSISYSSMVWTRSGPYIYFDENAGSPSPGFKIGFPTIKEKAFDAKVGDNVYLLGTPGGRRVGLRQLGTSNTYEAADSSYLQLIDYSSSLLVRATDGTRMTYQFFNHAWHCIEVRDRNGNYLTVSYNWLGQITSVLDTLGRTLSFNYDSNENLISITQSWTVNGVATTHQWATFGWGAQSIQTNFTEAMAVGVAGPTFPVLTQVGLDDGSRYNFEYNSDGQASVIRRFTSDNVQRSYTSYAYDTPTNDSPRLVSASVWAENWTGINGVPFEVVTQYSDPGDGSHQMIAPDGTVYKEFYGGMGGSPLWQLGLPIQTEVWSGGVREKWTTTNWTQDNTSVSYQANPRVTETNMYDASGNRRRVTVDYSSVTLPSGSVCKLPSDTREYAADAVNVLRRSHTDYLTSASYLDRHIVGLVSAQSLYEVNSGVETLISKVGFQYDEAGSILGTDAPVQHDNVNYSSSFVNGRANLSSVKRYDVINSGQWTVSSVQYNTAGSMVAQIDPLGHQNSLGYADAFSDGNNGRNTLAYPTSVTDADGFSSTIQYNFDFGAKTRLQGPPPAGQPQGLIQSLTYDSAARVERVTTANNGANTRYIYGPNYVQSWATVNTLADEAYTMEVFDGAGRVTAAATNHPGSTGGYSAVDTIYDRMGHTVKQSNPTEITGGWTPAGDDAAGWLYTQQTYNWQGKPLVTTNTDGTTKEASYSGCGCAGGEVVTRTDEVGRRQKGYNDVLGRTVKTEVLNWDVSVYSATVNTYNARDQVTRVRQYAGPEGSATFQDTSMGHDGYGRLKTKHLPEQNTSTVTTWDYNSDDTIQKVTDARGASATYGYNSRHQMTGITYAAPFGITPTPNVSFTYDAVGNRTGMTDGLGSVSYNYNTLSQLTSEARIFNDVGSFTLGYDYNLGGGLKSVTDPTNSTISYVHDGAGRLNSVTGSPYQGVTNYAANIQYRAWGGLKRFSFQNNSPHNVSLNYTTRMKVSHYEVNYTIADTATHGVDYQYEADGRLRSSHELTNPEQDRVYSYDHVGRAQQVLTGAEARGEPNPNGDELPFKQNYSYDALNNLTSRTGKHWGHNTTAYAATYVNNRNTNSQWQYNADGDLVQQSNGQLTRHYAYDAAGRQISVTEPPRVPGRLGFTATEGYDGEGLRAKRTNNGVTSYELRSTVLGGRVISDLNAQGQKVVTYIYADGRTLARQDSDRVTWVHDPPDGSGRWESYGGAVLGSLRTLELDPLGDDVGVENPYLMGGDGLGSYPRQGDPTDMTMGCMVNGQGMSCHTVMRFAVRIASAIEIHRPVGMNMPVIRSTWIGDDTKDSWDPNFETNSGNYYIGDGGHFEVYPNGEVESWLTLQQPNRVLIGFDTLWDDLASILDNGTCRSFIADLVGTAQELTGKKAHAFSVEGMVAELALNPMNGRDGINLIQTGGKGNVGYGGWDKVTGKGGVDLGDTSLHGEINENTIRWAHRNLARDFLHEIIHTATKFGTLTQATGGYSDVELARAIFEISGAKRDDPFARENNPRGSHPTTVGGVIYRRALEKYCP